MLKKTLAILMAIVLLAVIAGCSQTKNTNENQPKDTSKAEATQSAEFNPYAKYDPPIEVTSVRAIPNPATVNYLNGDTAESNEWTRLYLDKLGIKLKYLWMVDSSQWDQKLNLAITSGDIPDVFQVNMVQMYQLNDAGLIQDVGDAFEKYSTPYTKSIINESGPAQLNSSKINGKMMALPFTGLPKETGPVLMLRDDWLKNLGLQAPKTFDDLVNIMDAFVNKDPDGNGQKDTIGLVMDKNLFNGTNGNIANCFHSYPLNWIPDKNGQAVFGGIQPETRTLLQKMAELYKNGLIDHEFGSKDGTKALEPLVQGKAGIYFGAFWSPLYPWQSLFNNDTKADIGYYLMPSADGNPVKLYVPLGTNGYWVVNKNMKNPEAAVKMMNLWCDTFYGNKEDDVYNTLVNRPDGTEVWQNALVETYRGFKNLDAYYNVSAAYEGKKDIKELTPEERGVLIKAQKYDQGDKTMWAWKEIYCPKGIFTIVDQYVKNDWFVVTPYVGPPTKTELDKGTVLTDLATQTFIKIVTDASPIEEFDNFVSQWKSSGGDQWAKELNDWIASNK